MNNEVDSRQHLPALPTRRRGFWPFRRRLSEKNARRGVMAVLMALFLIPVLAMVAFSVDLGLMVLLRAEVQSAVDAGALAAAIELQNDPDAVEKAGETAKEFVQLNRAGAAVTIPEDAIEVETGRFDHDTKVFTPTVYHPNALRVFARQDRERFHFGRIFGHDFFGAPASAIAASASVPLDIVMVLDLSGSMADQGRIQALRNSAPAFVDVIERSRGNDRLAIMGLSADPSTYNFLQRYKNLPGQAYNSGLHQSNDTHIGILEAPLTDDFAYLVDHVLSRNNLVAGKYGIVPNMSYTGTGAAIGDAAHYLSSQAAQRDDDDVQKVIVLMSDGHANRPSNNGPGYARSMANYAAARNIKIYTISLGNDADVNLMRNIASRTDGLHFDATGSGEAELTEKLTRAFRQIASAIKRAQLVK